MGFYDTRGVVRYIKIIPEKVQEKEINGDRNSKHNTIEPKIYERVSSQLRKLYVDIDPYCLAPE